MSIADKLSNYYVDLNLFGKVLLILIALSLITVAFKIASAFTDPAVGAVQQAFSDNQGGFLGALFLYILIEGFGHKK